MPAAKKKKKVSKSANNVAVAKKVEHVSEQLNMMLVVFAVAMIMFAYVLYKTYVM